MEDLLSQLHDIRGIDNVSWWPPAPGWWGVLALFCVVVISVYAYLGYRRKRKASWQAHAKALFMDVRAQDDNKAKATALSEVLRKLAIHKYGRDECAGLEGDSWLLWLKEKDAGGFDWVRDGNILIKAPYARASSIDGDDLDKLIKAAERWVR